MITTNNNSRSSRASAPSALAQRFSQFAHATSVWSGNPLAFLAAVGLVIVWVLTGPIFNYSDTWQLVINTGTTIVTFLMVFLIQRSQNKEALAIQLKLNEIVAALPKANNRLIDAEDFNEHELEALHQHYRKLASLAAHDAPIHESHSVERAAARHGLKRKQRTAEGD